MIIHHADRAVVKWAVDQGLPYEYRREYGLPEPCLCVQMGLSCAFFKAGRLVQWRANAEARCMDQLMFELSSLYALCAQIGAYPNQNAVITPEERAALLSRRKDSA